MTDATKPTDLDPTDIAEASQSAGIADESAAYVNADDTTKDNAKDEPEAHPS